MIFLGGGGIKRRQIVNSHDRVKTLRASTVYMWRQCENAVNTTLHHHWTNVGPTFAMLAKHWTEGGSNYINKIKYPTDTSNECEIGSILLDGLRRRPNIEPPADPYYNTSINIFSDTTRLRKAAEQACEFSMRMHCSRLSVPLWY